MHCAILPRGGFTKYPFFVHFCPFLCIFSSPWKSMFFFVRIFVCPYPRWSDCQILDKSFSKQICCKGAQPYFEISLLSFTHKIFEQKFYQYVTVYVVQIWTYKNADEKAHTLSRRSKNVKKKRTKTDMCKFTFRLLTSLQLIPVSENTLSGTFFVYRWKIFINKKWVQLWFEWFRGRRNPKLSNLWW